MQFLRAVKNPGLIYTLQGSSNLYYVDNPLDTTVGLKLPGKWYSENKYASNPTFEYASCHSLMCYRELERSIYICNPITGDRFKLPTLTPPVKDTYRGSWGFGYAPLSKKYKYVQIIPKRIRSKLEGREHFTYTYTYTAEIFTLGGESWRELACVPLGLMSRIYPTADVYCNGTLYWAMSPSFNDVVSFDLETEEFQERRVLPIGTHHIVKNVKAHLAVLGENVAFIIHFPTEHQEVWMLMDEKANIWAKKYHLCTTCDGLRIKTLKLLGLWMNQDLYGIGLGTSSKNDGTGQVTRLLSYNADCDLEAYTAIQLPFLTNVGAESTLVRLVGIHAGSLMISPSKIGAAERKQPSSITG